MLAPEDRRDQIINQTEQGQKADELVIHSPIARINAGYLVGLLQAPRRAAGGPVNILN